MFLQIPAETFSFVVFILGSIAIVFTCLTYGIAYAKTKRLKLKKLFDELGLEDIE